MRAATRTTAQDGRGVRTSRGSISIAFASLTSESGHCVEITGRQPEDGNPAVFEIRTKNPDGSERLVLTLAEPNSQGDKGSPWREEPGSANPPEGENG